MKYIITIFVVWVLGSFATVGVVYIVAYALVTMALFVLTVVPANKKISHRQPYIASRCRH